MLVQWQYWLLFFLAIFLSQNRNILVCCAFLAYNLCVLSNINLINDYIDLDSVWSLFVFLDVIFLLVSLFLLSTKREYLIFLSCWLLCFLGNYQIFFFNNELLFNILNYLDIYNLDSIVSTISLFLYYHNKNRSVVFFLVYIAFSVIGV